MKDLALVRMLARSVAALGLAALSTGAALAQSGSTAPTPHVMTDAAPLPAQHRESLGAIVMPESPVLARREQLAPLATPPDTRAMGAGPARVLEERERERAKDEDRRKPAGTDAK